MTRATLISAVVASAVAATAFLLNPLPEQHRAQIKAVIAERSPPAGALGTGVFTAFTSSYHPLGVAPRKLGCSFVVEIASGSVYLPLWPMSMIGWPGPGVVIWPALLIVWSAVWWMTTLVISRSSHE